MDFWSTRQNLEIFSQKSDFLKKSIFGSFFGPQNRKFPWSWNKGHLCKKSHFGPLTVFGFSGVFDKIGPKKIIIFGPFFGPQKRGVKNQSCRVGGRPPLFWDLSKLRISGARERFCLRAAKNGWNGQKPPKMEKTVFFDKIGPFLEKSDPFLSKTIKISGNHWFYLSSTLFGVLYQVPLLEGSLRAKAGFCPKRVVRMGSNDPFMGHVFKRLLRAKAGFCPKRWSERVGMFQIHGT